MKIFPAIDLLGGKAVRLTHGLRDTAVVYHHEPWRLCAELAEAGAERIHVVDLDGAFAGAQHHHDLVHKILEASPVPVQVGGGIRSLSAAEAVLAAGARFVVLGTAAIKDPAMVETLCHAHRGRIVIAVDARDGVVTIEGWQESAGLTAVEVGQRAEGWGAAALLYTDVARDGAETGPNVAATAALAAAVGIPVYASGGVSSLDDLRALAAAGLPAVVVGRALYEQRFTLAEAIAAAGGAAAG
ncbi:MAG: 1-(5-phosphoribosyl)-5-[(5-phosphoribosylamino)methylideneamino]imidazole-4-carboxamide isomerase [Kofleriaceae bacterium]|nr:1-(5-phosphoribosyl)-5-[(5-phosphoribosylamino)methylideneamino]imidazole-4-carboxamide isomerase [Kofleriaceae bacterium]